MLDTEHLKKSHENPFVRHSRIIFFYEKKLLYILTVKVNIKM